MECKLLIYLKKYTDKNGVERTPCVYFKNHHKTLPVPFGIYADFECTTEKISSCQPPPMKKPKKGRPQKKDLTLKNIRNILHVVLVIKLFAIMIRSILVM